MENVAGEQGLALHTAADPAARATVAKTQLS